MTMTESNLLQLEHLKSALEGKDIADETEGGIILVKGLPGYMNLISYLDKTLDDDNYRFVVESNAEEGRCISNQYMRANTKIMRFDGKKFYRSSVHFNAPEGDSAPYDAPFVAIHSADAVFPTFSNVGLNEDGKPNMINGIGAEIQFQGDGSRFTERHMLTSDTFEIKELISSREMQELIITPREFNPEITPAEFTKTLSELTVNTNLCLKELQKDHDMGYMKIEL
ncbi:MAG: hypothetical protein GY861_10705 [bacterium]|nr:hypothetical protein [bacterium]